MGTADVAASEALLQPPAMTNLALWLENAGRDEPSRPALGCGLRMLRTYADVATRVARLAGALQAMGLKPGERVAIASKNSPDYLEALYAIWHAGLAAVPANAKLHGAELGYILEQSGARVCLASDGLDTEVAAHAPPSLERLIVIGGEEYQKLFAADAALLVPRDGNDLAWLFYTSGTTGRPKGAMLTHKALAAASHAYLAEVETPSAGDPLVHAAPMSHGSGLYIMARVMRRGVNVVPESAGFEADEIFELFRAWPGSSMFAAPTMVKRLVECGADCPSDNIGTIVYGGAPMYVADALKALAGQFDFLLVTVNVSLDWPRYLSLLGPRGRLHVVGAVLEPMSVPVFSLMGGQKSVSSSPVGSPQRIRTMLDFCARHGIRPQVETYPMAEVNTALQRLRDGQARYRIVLSNPA